MQFHTAKFDHPEQHHPKWFQIFRGKTLIEVWFGKRYWHFSWK